MNNNLWQKIITGAAFSTVLNSEQEAYCAIPDIYGEQDDDSIITVAPKAWEELRSIMYTGRSDQAQRGGWKIPKAENWGLLTSS